MHILVRLHADLKCVSGLNKLIILSASYLELQSEVLIRDDLTHLKKTSHMKVARYQVAKSRKALSVWVYK